MLDFRNLEKTFVVAEIGVNHEGDEAVAADLIRRAAKIGADAVKFQTFQVERYISTVQPERYERAKRFQLSRDAFHRLAGVAAGVGIVFFSTPLDMSDADFLEPMVPLFKISSGDLTHLELIRHVARKRKPMIVSTGLGTEAEIAEAIEAVRTQWPEGIADGQVVLMHCVATYPTEAQDANLRNIGWLKECFGLPVGYSDHTLGVKACELAVAAGAVALEKHFTYRKENQSFHDHLISADPNDLNDLVAVVRGAERYLGSSTRRRTESELKVEKHMRRSLGAATDIPAGVPVKAEWVTYLRPQWGLLPDELDRVLGRPLKRSVAAGTLITEEDLA